MKTHISLKVLDLPRSIAFYRTLLAAEPTKALDDYALFITPDPGLELALDRSHSVAAGEAAHFGIAVESVDAVDDAIHRLQAAGIATDVEREETCCYAKQTKVWSSDPDGRRWEIYAVLEETESRDGGVTCCSESDPHAVDCCAV